MNPKFRLLLYVVLAGCITAFAVAWYTTYHSKESASQPVKPSTNAVASTVTNDPAVAAQHGTSTNSTNTAAPTNARPSEAAETADDAPLRKSSPRLGRLMAYGIAMFFALVGLAIMIGHDVSRYLANRVEDFIFNDNLKGVRDPKYEEAETTWARGEHLEAVRLMRDYLKRHPREQYVALRIAEIYETDLRNYLAAALEYEEVLKKKLPAERWGWAAIHLANLYSGKLNKTEQATALLRRIVDQYGQTAAARKARERLGIPEPAVVPVAVAAPEPEPEPTPVPAKPEPPVSNLPPGFRPK
jgi:TolA-binding protein